LICLSKEEKPVEDPNTFTGTPVITSFVIRFIHSGTGEAAVNSPYRGSILNVQTNQELTFSCWEDAVVFISKFVPIVNEEEG
jgi:hypothetical protein